MQKLFFFLVMTNTKSNPFPNSLCTTLTTRHKQSTHHEDQIMIEKTIENFEPEKKQSKQKNIITIGAIGMILVVTYLGNRTLNKEKKI